MYTRVILKSGKDQSLRRLHPWVFSGAIKKIKGEVKEGDVVEVYDNKDEFLGAGHYQIGSIAVRVFSFEQVTPDEEYWKKRFEKALEYRKNAGLFNLEKTNIFRIIHAEGDGFPGLIVDYYNGIFVMQFHSIGMFYLKDILVSVLKDNKYLEVKGIYNKSESTLPHKANIKNEDGFLFGKESKIIGEEYGLKFHVNIQKGQKTGFFIDQRENRNLVKHYSEGRSVLNMFGYTGGFSAFAMAGNAKEVVSVDSSAHAIDMTNKNIKENFPESENHVGEAVDAFSYFEKSKKKFDLIILDPPAFAKHQNVLHNALQGYKRLNAKAIEAIEPNGIIFTFSCSQVVSKEKFRQSVFAAAANTGRKVRILHQLTQPIDHPVNIYHPESEYLKGLVLYVE
jgi:23S rRNA (cytosine1962-C5)-methyltransferase